MAARDSIKVQGGDSTGLRWLQRAAVAKVFTTADEYKLLEHRATCARVSDLIIGKGMFVMDAFRAFDSSNKVSDAAPMFMRFPIVSVANPILHPCFLLLLGVVVLH